MSYLLFLSILGVAASAPQTRIVGGSEANPGDVPWQVSLEKEGSDGSWTHFCGAAWLGGDKVLTAAHCVSGGSYRAVLGSTSRSVNDPGQQTIGVASFSVHPNFNFATPGLPFDVAVATLAHPAQSNSVVKSLSVAQSGADFTGTSCTFSGWGTTSHGDNDFSDRLQKATMTAITNDECRSRFSSTPGAVVSDASHMCAHDDGKSACNGDSGGPLVCSSGGSSYLAGVAVWGHSSCAGHPTVFTRLSEFSDWIGQQ